MTEERKEQKRIEVARQYVDKQLETMKKHGSAPKDLSSQEYNALVMQIAATVRV
jgi:hypothetical protein